MGIFSSLLTVGTAMPVACATSAALHTVLADLVRDGREHMSHERLRGTVERVAGAADRMQSAADEIASASQSVARANEAQVDSIDRASGSMGIRRQRSPPASSSERGRPCDSLPKTNESPGANGAD